MTMPQPPSNAISTPGELPEPGYPMLTHMVSNALFPDMQSKAMKCKHCDASISLLIDKSVWTIDGPHPLVSEMTVVRMFIVAGGVDVYSVSKEDSKVCMRSFVPMGGIRLIEEVMPLDVFLEELSNTVKPESPMIARMLSHPFTEKMAKVNCPSCKAIISVPVPIDKNRGEPVAWKVGQSHPFTLSGKSMKVLRILLVDDSDVEIYSVSDDGQSGMRHSIPIEWVRLTEEAMTPEVFVKELGEAEIGDDDNDDLEDPEDPDNNKDLEPEQAASAPTTNGQPQPS